MKLHKKTSFFFQYNHYLLIVHYSLDSIYENLNGLFREHLSFAISTWDLAGQNI